MDTGAEEPGLPYTPSHTGRAARVGYLGLEGVGFADLWPLFGGLVLSLGLGIHFFLGPDADPRRWVSRTLVAAFPAAAGFGYLRFLVQGRPPHFKGDLVAGLGRLRADFASPPLRMLPILPRLHVDGSDARGPWRASEQEHPLARRRRGRAGR